VCFCVGVPLYYLGGAPRRGAATCSRFQGPRILDIVPPKGASYPQPLDMVHGPRSGPQDVVCPDQKKHPPKGVRHYVTLTKVF
jgi:hypothetical protein